MKKKTRRYFDYELLIVVVFLACFGLVMLYSASAYRAQITFGNDKHFFIRQALISAASFAVMLFVSGIDYHLYAPISFYVYVAAMFVMALVKTPLGVEVNGARRWIQLPANMTLQPSEIMKIAVILFVPYLLCKMGGKINTRKGFWTIVGVGFVAMMGVFVLTENLSTALIVMGITCVMIFVVHRKTALFVGLVGGGIGCATAAAMFLSSNLTTSENFRLRRILTWLRPEEYADEGGYQVMQGLYAIGSGGFFGKGLGNSTQKLTAIPEVQNDMVLAVVCEELGVFGAIVVVALFVYLLYRLMFIARNAPDMYGSLIATGIFAHIALQVFLNIAVVINLIPTTGITLPFISYGGTSILFLMAEMGIALGISRTIKIDVEP